MPSRTRNYRGHVHKARSQILRIAVQFRFPFPLSARAKLPFCLFCLNSLHFDSGTTKRETEPASRRGFFLVSSRADLFFLSLASTGHITQRGLVEEPSPDAFGLIPH